MAVLLDKHSTNDRFRLIEIVAFVLLFGMALAFGVRLGGDSLDYILGRAFRSPGYIVVLKFYQELLGRHFWPLIIFQIGIGFAACIGFAYFYARRFSLPPWLRFGIVLFLLIPYFMRPYAIGNTVQSEAITVPFYLLFFALLIKALAERRVTPLYQALPVLVVLILTRKQLAFALPAVPLIAVYFAHLRLSSWRNATMVLLASLATLLAAKVIESAYNYIEKGHFATAPYIGVQLLNAPLYFSTPGDINLFPPNSEQRKYFTEFRNSLKSRGALFEDYKGNRITAEHYIFHYDGAYMTIWKLLLGPFGGRAHADWHKLDKVSLSLFFPLMKQHFKQVVVTYLQKIKSHFGGYYACLTLMIAGLAGLFVMWRRQATFAIEVFVLALLLSVLNAILVGVFNVFIARYSMYTEPFLYLSALIAVRALWHDRKEHNGTLTGANGSA